MLLFFLYMVFLRNKNGLWLLKQTPICQGGKEAFGLTEGSFPSTPNCRADSTAFLCGGFLPELCLPRFGLRRWSRGLFLPSCAGRCRSSLRCIRMCDVHLVCTYVHKYVKVLKIYFEYIQIKELIKKNQINVLLMICLLFYYSIKRLLWGICPFVRLLEPCP